VNLFALQDRMGRFLQIIAIQVRTTVARFVIDVIDLIDQSDLCDYCSVIDVISVIDDCDWYD